jgi:uncharacterized membrane protein
MEALPPLPGDNQSEASDVNDRGQVIGISYLCTPQCGPMHPVVWDGDQVMAVSGMPGAGSYNKPTGLNDSGEVVGTVQNNASPVVTRAFLAEPH